MNSLLLFNGTALISGPRKDISNSNKAQVTVHGLNQDEKNMEQLSSDQTNNSKEEAERERKSSRGAQ